jgi:two-component system, NtrC family, nitrogen regulation sensor histidine kinase NtrY
MKLSFQTYSLFLLLLIAGNAFVAGWVFFRFQNTAIALLCGGIAIYLIIHLLVYQNKMFRRINYFFEAVRNEDSALSFPKPQNDKQLKQLSLNLEKINGLIQRLKIESRQREQYFSALIEHVETGILSFDENGFVYNANKNLKQLLGLEQLTHLRQIEKIDSRLANVLQTIRPNDQKTISFTSEKQKAVNILIKSTSFISDNKPLMLLSIQDINEQLNEKELDSWLKLIRVLTHEIMNSIAPVTSLSENLKDYFVYEGATISPKEINDKIIQNTVKGLEVIEQQGKSLISFVESYRKLTRLPKPEMNILNVKKTIENAVILNKSFWPEIPITLQIKNSELTILGDNKMITQVLVNLLKNAAEALSNTEEGKIRISVDQNSQSRVEVKITDNGPGIPPELMDEIFVPFFTTRDNGSGIGLSLSRQIMRLHGGKLNARSVPGKETVFSMEFLSN